MADFDDKALTEQISNTPSPQGQGGDDDDAVEVGFRTWMAVFAGCMYPFTGFYIVICGASFTSYVVADIGGSSSITWLPNAYEVVVLALAAFMCSIGDVYGRRVLLLGGAALTFIGCILIAVAKNINVVIVGSALTAGLFANQGNFYTIPAEVLPKRYRGVGATLGAAAGGLGAVAAYLAEGAFIRDYERVGWRYGFYVGAFFAALSGVMLHFFYRPIHKPTKTIAYVLAHDIDWVGTGLQLVFAVPFLIGLNWGGNAYPWSSVHVIATMSVGGASLIALIIHQVFFKKNGLFNHDLFECRNFTISALGLFIEGIIFLALLLFLPYMILTMYETRPFMQSLRILPLWIAFTIFAPLVGLYSRRTRDLKNPLIAGFALVLIAVIVLATSGVKSGNLVIGMLFVAGVGFSAPLALFNATAQLAVPKRLLGLATGQFIAARAFGSSVGAIIFIAILTAKSTVLLPAEISKAAVAAGLAETSLPALVGGILLQNATLLESTPGLNPEIMAAALEGLKEGYSEAFHYGWYAVIPFVAIAILMCIGLDSAAIKSQMNWVVDNPVEEIHHVDHNLDHPKGEMCQPAWSGINSCAAAAPAFKSATEILTDPATFISEIKCACTDTFQSAYPQCVSCFVQTNQCQEYLGVPDEDGAGSIIDGMRQVCGFGSALLGGGVATAANASYTYTGEPNQGYSTAATTSYGPGGVDLGSAEGASGASDLRYNPWMAAIAVFTVITYTL